MQKEKFILCPVCGNKTRVQIREDTELKNITKAEVPDAKTQSR